MNVTVCCIACITSILLFSTTPVGAAEKKTVFNTESIKYESGTGAERCRDKCGRRSDPDVKSFLSEGWIMVRSSSKKVIGEHYRNVPCNTCQPHGCICIGTEYILEKDEPARKIETNNTMADAPDKDSRIVPIPLRAETPLHEMDLLKKENDALKQENAVLKQENEALRNRVRSLQK